MMYPYAESLLDPKNCSTKRVSRACDRCRLKKTKCDGRRCCNRCLADDAICVFSKRKRSSDRPYSSEYVQLLEDQQMKLVEGVQELYRRLRRGESWTGPEIAEDSQGYPLVQDVLDSLAVLAPSERGHHKRKASEVSIEEQDEEDDQSTGYGGSGRLNSISPPLTPQDCSQSSLTSTPDDNYPQDHFRSVRIPPRHQHSSSTSTSTSIPPTSCTSNQVMQCQPLMVEGMDYWTMNASMNTANVSAEWPGYVETYTSTQPNVQWYPGTYMMM